MKSSHTSKWSLMCLRRIPQQICPSCRLTLQWTTCLSEQVIVRSDLGSISLGSSLEAPRRCSSASLGTSWLDPPLDPRQPTCLMWTIACRRTLRTLTRGTPNGNLVRATARRILRRKTTLGVLSDLARGTSFALGQDDQMPGSRSTLIAWVRTIIRGASVIAQSGRRVAPKVPHMEKRRGPSSCSSTQSVPMLGTTCGSSNSLSTRR